MVLFGTIAIVTALLNIIWIVKRKDAKWFGFISLSFTALTLCAFYSAVAKWVIHEDWIALICGNLSGYPTKRQLVK